VRILHAISSFPPAYSYGGPVKSSYDLCVHLAERGHEVVVFTTDVLDGRNRLNYSGNPTELDGICVYRFRNVSNRLAHMNIPIAPGVAFGIKREISRFDVISLHEYRSFMAATIALFAENENVPFLLHPHGSITKGYGKQALKSIYDRVIGKRILASASRFIAVSNMEAGQFVNSGQPKNRIEIIPNGIDMSPYQHLPKRGSFRARYAIKEEEKVVLYLGRLHEIKGLDLLVHAYAMLVKEVAGTRLVIAGPDEGVLKPLKKLAISLGVADRVLFTGPLYGTRKTEAYVDSDVYVLPSRYEIFGNTVLEAMACGTPTIVTDSCGLAEFVSKIGLVVRRDPWELTAAIKRSLEDEGFRRRFMKEGAILVGKEFNFDGIIDKLEKTYQSCVERG